MGFMSSYKRLDNLCRDMNGKGVSGYIEDMESKFDGIYHISGFKDDYEKLKSYRHIRNRISHEDNSEEYELSTREDVLWLNDFYSRIIGRTDPLALYYKAASYSEKPARQCSAPLSFHLSDDEAPPRRAIENKRRRLKRVNRSKIPLPAVLCVLLLLSAAVIYILYEFNYIPHKKYDNADFGIETYISDSDKDGDGVDDQTDILNSVREYIATEPKYKSKYYASGYPDDGFGVCTDVVAFGLKGAGYDLMTLVNEDIKNNRGSYDVDVIDKNIDFRRVRNLNVYFERNAESLTTDISRISEWQGGDIVVFENHIGIVSDKRNKEGVPFIIHHANPLQRYYEEDILGRGYDIIGHYRIS